VHTQRATQTQSAKHISYTQEQFQCFWD